MQTPYTPAWAEKYTGMSREMVIRFAREWGETALSTPTASARSSSAPASTTGTTPT